MKPYINITAPVLIGALLFMSACNKLDITEEFELKATIDVFGNNAQFSGEQLLDAMSESDLIKEYSSHIKSIEVIEVRYLVTYTGGSATQQINAGTLEVADADGSGSMAISTVNNINLMQAMTEGSLIFDQGAVDKLAGLIKDDPHQAMIYLKGDVNETPADFTVVVKFKVKMVAEVI